jgi:hypothetical protein
LPIFSAFKLFGSYFYRHQKSIDEDNPTSCGLALKWGIDIDGFACLPNMPSCIVLEVAWLIS